jgi:ribose transport system substrate-binding protein
MNKFWTSILSKRTVTRLIQLSAVVALMGPGVGYAEDLTPEALAAKAVAEALMTKPVEWHGPTSSPTPFEGKRIAVITVTLAAEGAARPTRGIAEAGKALGWTVDIFDGKGDPQEQNKALNAAVDANYDGIALIFMDTAVLSDGVKRALDAKIPLITLGALDNTPATIPDVSHDWIAHGEAIGSYMIWKSNGHVDALLLKNTDLYIVEHGQFKGTYDVLSDPTKCVDCTLSVKDWPMAAIDTQPAAIASAALQSNPNTNWVWCFDSCVARVARTLIATGVGFDVKGAGFDCNGESLQMIKEEQIQVVSACDPRDWEAYGLVDNLNRMMHGEATINQNIPIKMFDITNIDQLTENDIINGWQGEYDFRSEYLRLWGKK